MEIGIYFSNIEVCFLPSRLFNAGKNPYSCLKWRDISDQNGGNTIEPQGISSDFIEGKLKVCPFFNRLRFLFNLTYI